MKGSYCQCHYCKCEKGHVSCKGYGKDHGGYGEKDTYVCTKSGILKNNHFQERVIAMEVLKESIVIVTIANVNMDLERKDTREDVEDITNKGSNDVHKKSKESLQLNVQNPSVENAHE